MGCPLKAPKVKEGYPRFCCAKTEKELGEVMPMLEKLIGKKYELMIADKDDTIHVVKGHGWTDNEIIDTVGYLTHDLRCNQCMLIDENRKLRNTIEGVIESKDEHVKLCKQ